MSFYHLYCTFRQAFMHSCTHTWNDRIVLSAIKHYYANMISSGLKKSHDDEGIQTHRYIIEDAMYFLNEVLQEEGDLLNNV